MDNLFESKYNNLVLKGFFTHILSEELKIYMHYIDTEEFVVDCFRGTVKIILLGFT